MLMTQLVCMCAFVRVWKCIVLKSKHFFAIFIQNFDYYYYLSSNTTTSCFILPCWRICVWVYLNALLDSVYHFLVWMKMPTNWINKNKLNKMKAEKNGIKKEKWRSECCRSLHFNRFARIRVCVCLFVTKLNYSLDLAQLFIYIVYVVAKSAVLIII